MEKGNLSINSENILPIIKKWLYSDKDIFLRELVSNASDAITKFTKLIGIGEASVAEGTKYEINVVLDKKNNTIVVSDNGIGMTADEVKEYITQIAFSGAEKFLEQYKDKLDKSGEIIGHFGLGFYSAFMVADKVEIDTLSYKEGSTAAKWECQGGIEYEMSEGTRTERGTTITLFLGEEGKEFTEEHLVRSTLKKYCGFMPQEIYFNVIDDKEETADETKEEKDASDDLSDTAANEDIIDEATADEADEAAPERQPINDICPLWTKAAKDCTDDEYKEFYSKVFHDMNPPLFWIHLNMDYPVRVKGILYFPKLQHEFETVEGQVKLFNNQVFVADNIKEVIPEFLLLLKGVIDCPDLPLNVSRSFLQNDGYAGKMSGYITKKVADKLNSLLKNDREQYTKFWDDISPFIKYGCIKERNFYDKIKDSLMFKTTKGEYRTLKEYLEVNKEKHENKVFYVTNENQQAQYIKLFGDNDLEAVILTGNLDTPFISFLEMNERGTTFTRIDSDISDSLKGDAPADEQLAKEQSEQMQQLFRTVLNKDKLVIKLENIKSETISGIILESEQAQRMKEMKRMFGNMDMSMFGMVDDEQTLLLNSNNGLVKSLIEKKETEDANMIVEHIYDLALLGHKALTTEEMAKFIARSNKLMEKILK